MLTILITVPWVLTVASLLYIMLKRSTVNVDDEYESMDLEEDEERHIIRAAIYDTKAFWVHDNIFYESDVTREPDWSTARPIDTMKLSEKSLSNLLKILDDLKKSEMEQ